MSNSPAPDASLRRSSHDCLSRQMRQASRAITAIYDEELRSFDLKTSQLNVLMHIGAEGVVTPTQLGNALQLEKSTVCRNVERMAARDWVEVWTTDAGGVDYRLSKGGKQLLKAVMPGWKRAQAESKKRLTAAGVKALGDLMRDLAE